MPTTTTTTPTTTTTTPTTTTTMPTTTTTTPTTTTTTPTTTTTTPTTTTTTPTTTTTTPTTTTTTPTTTTLNTTGSESASNVTDVKNGGLEIFIIPSVAGFVFLVNMLCLVMLTCGRKKRRKRQAAKEVENQAQKSFQKSVKADTESLNNFKIPRPSLNGPIYTNDYSTWGSSFSSFSPYGSVVYLNTDEVMYEEIDKGRDVDPVEKYITE
ncbi:A-agglutinin anchorage subunit-like [Mizuhopecten yessoensis]|uniref:A-agglutinin anchorage subunit-like n=1 Tax=Mizuhopecten yessoensis TaxID=6573 RepID=UPI000B459641|nr:A-agglutinin anchorage subunit-like [Mizuhopecten yessoensis]